MAYAKVSLFLIPCIILLVQCVSSSPVAGAQSSTSANGLASSPQQRKVRVLSQQPGLARLYRLISRGNAGFPSSEDEDIQDDADSYFQKRQQYDDYGHMRFGKRNPKDFDDYGHMRFGK